MGFMALPRSLIHTLKHLFVPRTSNNHRPKVFLPQSLTFLAAFMVILNLSVQTLARSGGRVLGYASDITLIQILDQVNQKRIKEGLNELVLNEKLSEAARRKAADMFTFNYWAHTNPQNGTDPWYFFEAVDYKYRYAGENLARDFATTSPMVEAWMDSPTHRENILSSKYQETGIAVVDGELNGIETTLAVQLFGTQQTAAAAIPDSGTKVQEVQKVPAENSETRIQAGKQVTQAETGVQGKRAEPLISPLTISKSFGIATLILLAGVLIVDSVVISLRKTRRIAGRNWAHLAFIIFLIVLVGSLQQGLVK